MTALRTAAQQALETLELEMDTRRCKVAITALRAALAQQEEPVEPVAWMFELARNFNLVGYGGWEKRITEYRPNVLQGSVRNVTPLYTAPPQRKLVPLVDPAEYDDAGAAERYNRGLK